MANIDCRIVAMVALAITLLLLSSVIFIRHHHHNGESSYTPDELPALKHVSPLVMEGGEGGDTGTELEEESTFSQLTANSDLHISDVCLQCICEVETGCKPKTCAGGDPCGPFRIHKSYWIDAGKPTKDGSLGTAAGDSRSAYIDCVNSPRCAARTVSEYVRVYSRDCNEDGVIDCADYMLIHHFGPRGCMLNEDLRMEYKLVQCLHGSPE